jgi:hypothetical protein
MRDRGFLENNMSLHLEKNPLRLIFFVKGGERR